MEEKLTLLMSREEIAKAVARIAREIERDLSGNRTEPPILIGVLKGAFVFTADLSRELKVPVEVGFVRTTSYGLNDLPSDKVSIIQGIEMDIRGRDVILVEDIVDRGLTITTLIEHLEERAPASVRICTLLSRPSANNINSDYIGVSITDDSFIVGYGMDYKERYRDLPELYTITPSTCTHNDK